MLARNVQFKSLSKGFKVNKDVSFQRAFQPTFISSPFTSQTKPFSFNQSNFSTQIKPQTLTLKNETNSTSLYFLLVALGIIVASTMESEAEEAAAKRQKFVDWDGVREDILELLHDENKQDGWGPIFVRLAWHASGTYSVFDKTGGSNGATMRFCPESRHGANNGLKLARDALEAVKARHTGLSYADLWVYASLLAIKEMGGPDIRFVGGRTDAPDGFHCPPDGRLPDATRNADHIRAIFYRMGFSDREIVALLGAHALGRCHPENSGFNGPWTHSPNVFSNDFYVQLLNTKWEKVQLPNGNFQFNDPAREIMMLPADMELVNDEEFRKWTTAFALDEDFFFNEFANAYSKLVNFNLPAQAN